MGRIGQSLIMPGQPPYCSLFSVCRADDGRHRVLIWGVLACARVCVCVYISMRRARWDRATAGKKDPTLSHPPTPPASRLCLSKLDFILQKQSGMNNSFSSPSFCFFLSFIPLLLPSFSCLSFLLQSFFILCLSWYFFFSNPPPFLFSFLPPFCSSSWHCEYCSDFSLSL